MTDSDSQSHHDGQNDVDEHLNHSSQTPTQTESIVSLEDSASVSSILHSPNDSESFNEPNGSIIDDKNRPMVPADQTEDFEMSLERLESESTAMESSVIKESSPKPEILPDSSVSPLTEADSLKSESPLPSIAPDKSDKPKPLKVPLFNKHGLPIPIMQGPEEPSNTLYIRNLPERTGPTTLRRHLTRMFEQFGSLLEVRCFRGLSKRGQAWIIFKSKESAKAAMNELHGQSFSGKPMIVQFSRLPSDIIAKSENKLDEYDEARKKRKVEREKEVEERRERKRKIAVALSSTPAPSYNSRVQTVAPPPPPVLPVVPPVAPLVRPQVPPTSSAPPLVPPLPFNLPVPPSQPTLSRGFPPPPAPPSRPGRSFLPPHLPPGPPLLHSNVSARPTLASMPDEFAPPNPTLFVSNLPNDATEEKLNQLFNSYPGFKEVRLVPGKAGIAFVEYRNEFESGVAKRSLHDTLFPESDKRMKITFRK